MVYPYLFYACIAIALGMVVRALLGNPRRSAYLLCAGVLFIVWGALAILSVGIVLLAVGALCLIGAWRFRSLERSRSELADLEPPRT